MSSSGAVQYSFHMVPRGLQPMLLHGPLYQTVIYQFPTQSSNRFMAGIAHAHRNVRQCFGQGQNMVGQIFFATVSHGVSQQSHIIDGIAGCLRPDRHGFARRHMPRRHHRLQPLQRPPGKMHNLAQRTLAVGRCRENDRWRKRQLRQGNNLYIVGRTAARAL